MKNDLTTMEERSRTVIKDNYLIQKTISALSVKAQKLLLYLISRIKPDSKITDSILLEYDELCDICGISNQTKNVNDFRNALKELMQPNTYYIGRFEEMWAWIVYTQLEFKDDHGRINSNPKRVMITFNPALETKLIDLHNKFTSFVLENILVLDTKYAIRLYELLSSYKNLSQKEYPIDELKELLQTPDYDWDKFREKILKPSVEDINTFTDLVVEYDAIKNGRKIESVFFKIRVKNTDENLETMAKRLRKFSTNTKPQK